MTERECQTVISRSLLDEGVKSPKNAFRLLETLLVACVEATANRARRLSAAFDGNIGADERATRVPTVQEAGEQNPCELQRPI